VIEAFSHGIMAKWQFQDFCKENPRYNEEFRRVVEKMIMAEEKTRKKFSNKQPRKQQRQPRQKKIFKQRTSGQEMWTRQHRRNG
jgi:hypothetical protein